MNKKFNPEPGRTLTAKSKHTHPDKERVIAQTQKEENHRMVVDVPVSLYKELRLRAAAEGCSMRSIILEGLRIRLKK